MSDPGIDCGLAIAEFYLQWLATDPNFSVHCLARRDDASGQVHLHFGDGEAFRVAAWEGLPDAAIEGALGDWIKRQMVALPEIRARPVDQS
jgi:hypothetical protein